MPRTVTSAQPTTITPGLWQPTAQQAALDMVWSAIYELFPIGKRYGALERGIPKLAAQLIRPGAEQREGYLKSCIRYDVWMTEMEGARMRYPTLLSNLATHLGKLSQRQRLALISNDGWPATTDPKQMAERMWEMFKAENARWPQGEPPFLKDELSDWIAARMAEERQQIVDWVTERYARMQRLEAAA